MTYPGNPNLADDVQRRVLSTFESMLREVVKGNHEEALLGCSLIERMDPRFKPGTELRSRLERGSDEPVDVSDLAELLNIELPAPEDEGAAPGVDSTPASTPSPADTETPPAEEPQEPHDAGDEPIETVESEAFEDGGERIEVLSDDEMREVISQSQTEQANAAQTTAEGGAPEDAAAEVSKESAEDSSDPEEEDDRVAALLVEGQTAFDAGEYQTAIDAWSRVFLIDLDHVGASEKVEEAKRLLAEREREAEELFHAALENLEAGDADAAREQLEKTLKRQPGHVGAREHLDRLKAGVTPPEGTEREADATDAGDLAAEPQRPIGPADSVGVDEVELSDGPPRDFGAADTAAAQVEASTAPAATGHIFGLSPRFLALAGLGLLVIVIGAWFLFNRRDSVFPNTTAQAEAGAIHAVDRAQRLHARGRLDAALNTLEAIPATDPRYSEAQTLIDHWQQQADAALAEVQQAEADTDAEVAAERADLIMAARSALASGMPHRAMGPLAEADKIEPLSEQEAALRATAADQLATYGDVWLAFRDGDYRTTVRPLWERVRENPDDAIARDMLVTSQFNLARASLVSGNPTDAAAMLSEATKMAPRDREIQQALRFAEHYVGLPPDLRYRIFIKHLPIR